MDADDLIRKHLDEIASPEELAELDRLLREDPRTAAAFARASRRDQALHDHFREEKAIAGVAGRIRRAARPWRRRAWIGAAAAAAVALVGILFYLRGPETVATLRALEGSATVEREGEREAARAGLELWLGDRLETVEGRATVVYADGTLVVLEPGGSLRLEGSEEGKRVTLIQGDLEAAVAPQPPGRPMTLGTPHAEARVLGTKFALSVSRDSTRLSVREGRVRLTRRADGEWIDVPGGLAAAADASRGTKLVAVRSPHEVRFLELYGKLHDPANGYFSPGGVPYHSAETLIVDAPDYGHLTTSETLSYWVWLEAAYGRVTGDWSRLAKAWAKMEDALIPSAADQPTNRFYDPRKPATVAPERKRPEEYPVALDPAAPVGEDSLAEELAKTHGTRDLYAMHWLADPDDWYGFGRRGERGRGNALINTFQRGPRESVWETVPHPSWEDFRAGGPNGFLDLFIQEPRYAKQWRYVCAPDADARVIQAVAWAARWAQEQGRDPGSVVQIGKAVRLGDTLRYALREKYFRGEPHYLLSWSFGWGGSLEAENGPSTPLGAGWAWRAGASHVHFGYQNPFAAWALSELPSASPGARRDWAASLARQLEFLRWLQSDEGAIAGGATAAADGKGDFYGLAYAEHPVFLDPPSNEWFGWQAWAMERVAAYASLTQDPRARAVLDPWVAWVRRQVLLLPDGDYAVPSTLRWSGRPEPWSAGTPRPNANLHVQVAGTTTDVGVAAALARALIYHGAPESREIARRLLEAIWLFRDPKGVSVPEARPDYSRFFERAPLPEGWRGQLAWGPEFRAGATFADLRSQHQQDPEFPKMVRSLRSGAPPTFRYHRFWAQVEVALAFAEFARTAK